MATTLVRPFLFHFSSNTAYPAFYLFSVLTLEFGDGWCRSPLRVELQSPRSPLLFPGFYYLCTVTVLEHMLIKILSAQSRGVVSGVKDWRLDQQLNGPKWHLQMHLQAVKCGAAEQLISCHPAANWHQLMGLHRPLCSFFLALKTSEVWKLGKKETFGELMVIRELWQSVLQARSASLCKLINLCMRNVLLSRNLEHNNNINNTFLK